MYHDPQPVIAIHLVSTVQPFTGNWDFVFKKNKDLKKSSYKGYSAEQRELLLATQEPIAYPDIGSSGWTYDLLSLLSDPDLGKAHVIESTDEIEKIAVDVPGGDQTVIIETEKDSKRKRKKSTQSEDEQTRFL